MALTAEHLEFTNRELTTLREAYDTELAADTWLPGEATYRRRGYQCYAFHASDLLLKPVEDPPPYRQAMDVNSLVGGIARSFRLVPYTLPVTEIASAMLTHMLNCIRQAGLLPYRRLVADVHFIRILAPGEPAPEGIHRDGLIAGSVHLVQRINARGGASVLFDPSGTKLCEFLLEEPLDSFIFDDERLMHYAEPVERVDSELQGHRDVLLFGIREEGSDG